MELYANDYIKRKSNPSSPHIRSHYIDNVDDDDENINQTNAVDVMAFHSI
jgi:hypothetical protein